MNNTSVYNLKNISLSLSATVLTACLVMPLTANADTSSSVDAIMEQLKSLKAHAPKVSTPAPVVEETKTEEKTVISEPVVVEQSSEKAVETTNVISVETAPVVREEVEKKSSMTVDNSAVMIPETKKSPAPVTHVKHSTARKITKRKSKKHAKKKAMMRDYEAFDKNYMALINQILNESPKSHRPANAMQHSGKRISGWIYLGRYVNGKWEGSNTLSSGNALPQAGQQYTVKSTRLNLRKSRPLKGGLGKLVKVLRAGEQVRVQKVHRSSRNNYWASVSR
ncbi:MAG: hypothetical protein DSZ29_07365 [Aquificaceae bacterium]|nr:MAG: hypothetical protein DSZ29_07365 [Aquificaceae bacterium]